MQKSAREKSSRCVMCRKKLGFYGYQCRCDLFFCSEHIIANVHECAFDYQKEYKRRLKKEMPKIVGNKNYDPI